MKILKLLILRLVIALILIGSIFPVFTTGAGATIFIDHTRINLTHISLTINLNGATGLDFGNLNPSDTKKPASTSITITNDGADNVTVSLNGTDFTGAARIIDIGNAFYSLSNDPETAQSMSTTDKTLTASLSPGNSVTVYHWLSIPAGTPPGAYTSNFSYTTH